MNGEIIAHRGFSALAPENTLVAFEAALAWGADSLEFDLQLSADRIPVIFHDETLTRITGVAGKVREKTLAQLKKLDVGKWFAARYAGQTIPSLAEASAIFIQVKQFLYFDLKPYGNWSRADLQSLLNFLRDEHLAKQSIITSFNEVILQECRQLEPQIGLGYFWVEAADFQQQLAKAAKAVPAILSGPYQLWLEHPEAIGLSRERGVDVVAWTVDSPEDWLLLAELGMRRIMTNSLLVKETLL